MAATIKTTRMELLALKKKVKLASKGYKLLKEKRDALISEFFALIDEVKRQRKQLNEKLNTAYNALLIAEAVAGKEELEIAAGAVKKRGTLNFGSNAIMGVRVPVLNYSEEQLEELPYSVMTPSVQIDELAEQFREVLKIVIKLAEIEATAKALGEGIKTTKRKVNALESVIIPRLQSTVAIIIMRLEEMERENFSRLKIIKTRMEAG